VQSDLIGSSLEGLAEVLGSPAIASAPAGSTSTVSSQQQTDLLLEARKLAGARSADELVASVYAAVPQALWPAAAQSTRATLAKLVAEGRAVQGPGDAVRPA
jgi:hypothetical protein